MSSILDIASDQTANNTPVVAPTALSTPSDGDQFSSSLFPSAPSQPVQPTQGQPAGLVEPGNLNLSGRPVIQNADGSHSSEYSTSFGTDKGEVLVPTVVNGKFLTPDGTKPLKGSGQERQMYARARDHYRQTGQHLGIFDTPENADAYATAVHNRNLASTAPTYVLGSTPINVQFPGNVVIQFPSAAHATQHAASVWQQIKNTTADAFQSLLPANGSLLDDEHFGKFIGHIGDAWQALNTPVGDFGGHEGRTQDLVTRGMTMGMGTADVERSLQNPENYSHAGAKTMLVGSWAGKDASAAKSATDLFTTPLGIATFGVGGMLTRLAAREAVILNEVNKSLDILLAQKAAGAAPEVLQNTANDVRMARNAYEQAAMLHRSLKVVETSAAAGFGGAGAQQAAEGFEQYRTAKTPQAKAAAASQFLQGTSQAILGGTAMAHGAVSNPADTLSRVDKALAPIAVPKADTYSVESKSSVESKPPVTTPVKPETKANVESP